MQHEYWAAWYDTRLLIKLTPEGVVFSFLLYNMSAVEQQCVYAQPQLGVCIFVCGCLLS